MRWEGPFCKPLHHRVVVGWHLAPKLLNQVQGSSVSSISVSAPEPFSLDKFASNGLVSINLRVGRKTSKAF